MKKRIAIAIKLLGGVLLHTQEAKQIEDFTPVLYTEKRVVRVVGTLGQRSMTYAVNRGEQGSFSIRNTIHQLHHHWQRCRMRLSFNY